MESNLTIVTFRDIFQYEAMKLGRYTDEYRALSAQIILDKQDMAKLGVKDGQSLLVQNDLGKIVVAAKTSDDEPLPGLAFMITSPWSNQLLAEDICSASARGFKGISARVMPSAEKVTGISEILARMRA
jgi:formylmethanofuran dehydrogenase subunit D